MLYNDICYHIYNRYSCLIETRYGQHNYFWHYKPFCDLYTFKVIFAMIGMFG